MSCACATQTFSTKYEHLYQNLPCNPVWSQSPPHLKEPKGKPEGKAQGISQLGSHYRHSQLPNNGFATAVAYAEVTAVAANEDPVLDVVQPSFTKNHGFTKNHVFTKKNMF